MTNPTVVEWFDGLEAVLEKEASVTGLLAHSSTIGQAREFLVARLLKTILPTGVHIGSGKVIDSDGKESKQVDIIIYDPRFPLMKLEGGGLYPVEGVLATIEIKSSLDDNQLRLSLENCRSVLDLRVMGEHREEAERQIAFYMHKGEITHAEAQHRFLYRYHPATYVFSFNSKTSLDTTCKSITSWWEGIGWMNSNYFPLLPRVIVAGGIVGVTNDGRITLSSDTGNRHAMSVFETNLRFRWFAVHLMDAVSARLGLRNYSERFDYRLTDYYPFDEYKQAIAGAPTRFITAPVAASP